MTTLSNEQLRELQEFIKSCFGMEPKEDWYDSYRYDDRVRIRDFITADRKRVALEARIDELENNKWLPNEAKWIEQEADRIAELKAKQEEV